VDLKQIEKLMKAMEELRIKRVALKKEDFEIEIERECQGGDLPVRSTLAQMPFPPPSSAQPSSWTQHASSEHTPPVEALRQMQKGTFVTSPMVGTLYLAPSPEDPPFVKVGDVVNENTIVCIIEAMKVMNEVKAGVQGSVMEILVRNGDPVEFGTRIIRVE
jgi:acetyl-CoA carboxylase biotin carboxyl carrier protein